VSTTKVPERREELAKTKVGINGFGRIGRQVFRTISERHPDTLEVVTINDLGDAATNAHLFKYDSTYGVYAGTVETKGDDLVIDGRSVKVLSQRDPANLPWSESGVELVIESTGFFTDATKAAGHLSGGAKKVIISAPAKNEDITIVLGVNQDSYDPAKHKIVSNASCTTNCVAPMAKVLHDEFGIESALMSTIHAYTNDQSILDQVHEDLRRARAAANSIIPTTTGAAKAVTLVIPDLKGRIDGMAYRVPVITGSVTDLTCKLNRSASAGEINEAFKTASANGLKGILGVSDEPLVSVDYIGNPNSCTIDAPSTSAVGDGFVKVVGWYDNEWGYSSRTADLADFMVGKGL
jgi:glyceraldehyde 3-phosphate dehydrogenase